MRFARSEHGATAVEFALVAVPFLTLACGCLENSVVFFEQEILQQAVSDAGRQIYTGNFQTTNSAITDSTTLLANFRRAICYTSNGVARTTIFDCSRVRINISSASSFAGATPISPTAQNASGVTNWNESFGSYTCARSSTIIVVQAAVDVPAYFTFPSVLTASLPNNRRMIQAATVFKVEPYTTKSVCS